MKAIVKRVLARVLWVSLFGIFFLMPGIDFIGIRTPSVATGQQYATCAVTGASPLQCASAAEGFVTIAAAAQTVQVFTTAVTPNARILLTYDSSLGTLLGVTCNTTAQLPTVTARATNNFTIGTAATFTTNPGCITFKIISQ